MIDLDGAANTYKPLSRGYANLSKLPKGRASGVGILSGTATKVALPQRFS